eukprot:evm.model.scf_3674.2 EVM.evm.TU.scf_3674.2   scf_3674:6334-10144(+)
MGNDLRPVPGNMEVGPARDEGWCCWRAEAPGPDRPWRPVLPLGLGVAGCEGKQAAPHAKQDWTPHEDKVLETVLAQLFRDPDRVQKIADMMPSKGLEACTRRIRELEEDIGKIESEQVAPKKRTGRRAKGPRKKSCRPAVPWSLEEHLCFLVGLERCGKGDWCSISRTFVITRSPAQVASHAQKFFLRRAKISVGKKGDRRRASINDITSLDFSTLDHHGQAAKMLLDPLFCGQRPLDGHQEADTYLL